MNASAPAAVTAWLESFAAAVRARDLDAGRTLFADDVQGFGTAAEAYETLDELVAHQWSDVWPRTTGFVFDVAAVRTWPAGRTCTVATTWASVGVRPDGEEWGRRGRATFVLVERDGHWLAVHSHFSMSPGVEA